MTGAPLSRLRAARVAAGLTCRTAGALIGRSPSHYAKIERGEVQLSAASAAVLCQRLGMGIASLLDTAAESRET